MRKTIKVITAISAIFAANAAQAQNLPFSLIRYNLPREPMRINVEPVRAPVSYRIPSSPVISDVHCPGYLVKSEKTERAPALAFGFNFKNDGELPVIGPQVGGKPLIEILQTVKTNAPR